MPMLILLGVLGIGLGLAAAAASVRTPEHRTSLERWGAALFVGGVLLAGLGVPAVTARADETARGGSKSGPAPLPSLPARRRDAAERAASCTSITVPLYLVL
jgi:hypothetical protein